MSEFLETNPVYFHNCPMFGPNTRVPRALLADKTGNYILYYQHKCLCGYIAGEKEMAPGVTETADGYRIDPDKVEKLYNGS